jgi:hypothetical protein
VRTTAGNGAQTASNLRAGNRPILSHYAEKASLLEFDGEHARENIAQELVMAMPSMFRISMAGAKNVQ